MSAFARRYSLIGLLRANTSRLSMGPEGGAKRASSRSWRSGGGRAAQAETRSRQAIARPWFMGHPPSRRLYVGPLRRESPPRADSHWRLGALWSLMAGRLTRSCRIVAKERQMQANPRMALLAGAGCVAPARCASAPPPQAQMAGGRKAVARA